MATFTANYNLRKPAGGDLVTVSSDINASMDIIDAELDDHEDRLDTIEPKIANIIKVVHKAAAETVTNSAVMQNDDDLFFVTDIGVYIFDFYLIVSGTPANDIKLRFTWNNGTLMATGVGPDPTTGGDVLTSAMVNDTVSPSNDFVFGIGAVTDNMVHLHCRYDSTIATTFRLQWAQNSAGAGTTATIKEGSHLIVMKVQT